MVHFSKEYWLVLALMAVTLAAAAWVRAPKTVGGEMVDLRRFPKQIAGWTAVEDSLDARTEQVLRTDQVLLRHYTDVNGRSLRLFVGYFQDQKFGAQVHSPLHCLPGSGWTIIRQDKIALPSNSEERLANKLHIEKNGTSQLVVYWFASSGSIVKNEFDLKIRLMLNAFQHQATSVYFYRVSIAFAEHEEKVALKTVQEFLKVARSYINDMS